MSERNSFLLVGGLIGCLVVLFCVGAIVVTALTLSNPNTPAPAIVDRIAYLDNDNNVVIIDPRGENRRALTTDASSQRVYTFPSFAPNSQSVAYMGVSGAPTQREGALYSAAIAPGLPTIVHKSAAQFPFYLYWAPDSQRIGFLTQSHDELVLMLGYADGKPSARKLDSGSPLYWSWSPDSRTLLLHVGGNRHDSPRARLALARSEEQTQPASLSPSPASFQAPHYSPDGTAILYAASSASGQDGLYVADAQGAGARLLANYRGRIAFAWSPDGNQIAYSITPAAVRLPYLGAVEIAKKDGSANTRVIEEDALAYYWSPDNKKIAYLTIARPGEEQGCVRCSRAPELASFQDTLRLRWKVKSLAERQTTILATFVPTDEFFAVLPYFDQYARSLTFWSPDSQHFVFTQSEGDGKGSVWVADLTGDGKSRRIGDGTLAVWSWK